MGMAELQSDIALTHAQIDEALKERAERLVRQQAEAAQWADGDQDTVLVMLGLAEQ